MLRISKEDQDSSAVIDDWAVAMFNFDQSDHTKPNLIALVNQFGTVIKVLMSYMASE